MKIKSPHYIIVLLLISLMLSACNGGEDNGNVTQIVDYQQQKESIEKANRYLVAKENEEIKDYIERRGLNFERTGTGLAYCILNQGKGLQIKRNEVISIEYEVRLLTGDVLYSSKQDGIKTFTVSKGGVESGLEEAVSYMRHGDVAEVVIPSHLAHGLIGDGNKVPPRATLIYKIKIL